MSAPAGVDAVGLHRLVAVVAALVMLTAAPVAQARPPAGRHRAQPTPVRAVRVPMLMYHLIATRQPATPNQGLWVDPSEFQAEVRWLAGHGYHAVTVAQWWDAWHGGIALPSRPIVFTFDDANLLCDLHLYLEDRFARHLTLLRNRTGRN